MKTFEAIVTSELVSEGARVSGGAESAWLGGGVAGPATDDCWLWDCLLWLTLVAVKLIGLKNPVGSVRFLIAVDPDPA